MAVSLERRGDGAPLVLLHGLGSSRSIWRRMAAELRPRRLVIAPDLPGFGESAPAGPGFDLGTVADRVGEACADAAGGRFDLVGHSLGGAVALCLARRRPDLVAALVLSSPAGFAPRSAPVAALATALTEPVITARRIVGSRLAGSGLARRAILLTVAADGARLDPADARLILDSSRGATRLGPAVGAVAAADLRDELRAVEAPVGVIWGERDRIFPVATVGAISETLPGVPVERIPDAGHVAQLERPHEFARALERLLKRIGATGRAGWPEAGD